MTATPEIIFSTKHGSHLYGMATPMSDRDNYIVTTGNRKAQQVVAGSNDNVTIGWDYFLEYAYTGSHQSLEAMFSPYKVFRPGFEHLASFCAGYRAAGPQVFAKYERTIKSFSFGQDFKRRRHACRLWLNLQDLRQYGRFDPVMTPAQIAWATEVATSSITGEELSILTSEGANSFGNFFWEED